MFELNLTKVTRRLIWKDLNTILDAVDSLQETLEVAQLSTDADEDLGTWDQIEDLKEDVGDIGILRDRIARHLRHSE